MEWQTISQYAVAIIGWLLVAYKQVRSWIETHRNEIQAIMLRVQKEATSDMTDEQKEQAVLNIFNQEILPNLSPDLKLFYQICGGEKWVRAIIKDICKKASALKDSVVNVISNIKSEPIANLINNIKAEEVKK